MNSLLTGLAIPTALSATSVAARTLQTLTQPFSNVLQMALDRSPDTAEAGSKDSLGSIATNTPHAALLGELLTGEANRQLDGEIKLHDIRTHAESLRDGIEKQLQQALQDAGVDIDSDVLLRINPSDGAVEVVGDHPQRVAIEAVFAGDPQLSSDFRQLVAINQLVLAADESRQFAKAYEENPWQAVSKYRHLFDGRQEAVLHVASANAKIRLDF